VATDPVAAPFDSEMSVLPYVREFVMNSKHRGSRESGQGLVEYALILALVAVVVVAVASLLGPALQRVYGVITASLGSKYDTVAPHHAIKIEKAQCIALQSANLTGLWVVGYTDQDVANLTGSTERAVGTGLDGLASPVEDNGDGGFKFHPLLVYSADLSVCPKAVVIQALDGAIAVAPVIAVSQP
jgi:pilus assembly protein Flp/PilA